MAKIVPGLFGLSPEQVQQQQKLEDFNRAQTLGVLTERGSPGYGATAMGVSQIGSGIIGGLNSLLGIEDPQLMKAKDIEQIIKDTQNTLGVNATPDEMYQGLYNRLSDKGYAQEALFALDARQKYLDNARTMDLKEKELEATLGTAQARLNKDNANYRQKQADNQMKINERRFKIISDQYDDPESALSQQSDNFANSFNVDDPDIVKGAYQSLHKELQSMTTEDAFGNLIPVFRPGQALKMTEKILSSVDEDDNLKYIETGNWNPFKGTSVNLPADILSEIKRNVLNEMGIQETTKSSAPPGLEEKELEAWKWATEKIKTDPDDPLALEILKLM